MRTTQIYLYLSDPGSKRILFESYGDVDSDGFIHAEKYLNSIFLKTGAFQDYIFLMSRCALADTTTTEEYNKIKAASKYLSYVEFEAPTKTVGYVGPTPPLPTSKFSHVMIDLETLGTRPSSVFLSLAAVCFDPNNGETGSTFSMNVNLESAMKRSISPDTLQWWMEQRPEIMKLMFKDTQPISVVLERFREFLVTNGITTPWGNSASFDLGILTHAYDNAAPWKFYNERCYRTVAALLPKMEHLPKSGDTAHDPIYDCQYQIANLSHVLKALNIVL